MLHCLVRPLVRRWLVRSASHAPHATHTGPVFSGIQPTGGGAHIGNYLGAIRNWVDLQKGTDSCIFCIVDLHALTASRTNAAELRSNVHATAATLLACGIDPSHSILYQQSHVPEHTELAWVLTCLAPMGLLARMTQYKTKVQAGHGTETLGLFAYPVLMAADILLYRAATVPVGDDQLQHLELAREVARLYNQRYGGGQPVFPMPQALVPPHTARVMSLRDGTAKMSKSDAAESSRLHLHDPPDSVASKIARAKTDSLPTLSFDPAARPEVSNLLSLFAAVTGRPLEAVCADTEVTGRGMAHFKRLLTEALNEHLAPIRRELQRLEGAEGRAHVAQVLTQGAERARALATATMRLVRQQVGLS